MPWVAYWDDDVGALGLSTLIHVHCGIVVYDMTVYVSTDLYYAKLRLISSDTVL